MTKKETIAELTTLGIEFDKNASLSELTKLLDGAEVVLEVIDETILSDIIEEDAKNEDISDEVIVKEDVVIEEVITEEDVYAITETEIKADYSNIKFVNGAFETIDGSRFASASLAAIHNATIEK